MFMHQKRNETMFKPMKQHRQTREILCHDQLSVLSPCLLCFPSSRAHICLFFCSDLVSLISSQLCLINYLVFSLFYKPSVSLYSRPLLNVIPEFLCVCTFVFLSLNYRFDMKYSPASPHFSLCVDRDRTAGGIK